MKIIQGFLEEKKNTIKQEKKYYQLVGTGQDLGH